MESVRRLIEEAIQVHLEALREYGDAILVVSSTAGLIDVSSGQ